MDKRTFKSVSLNIEAHGPLLALAQDDKRSKAKELEWLIYRETLRRAENAARVAVLRQGDGEAAK